MAIRPGGIENALRSDRGDMDGLTSYDQEMRLGRGQYADVIEQLRKEGLPTTFTQTGGMNAALEVQLETGEYLLITDAIDSLAWTRADHRGWSVGRYRPEDDGDGPHIFGSCESNDFESLLRLVREVLLGR